MKKIMSMVLTVTLILTAFIIPASAMTMYAFDGRTADIQDSEADAWEKVGWTRYAYTTLYALDGRELTVRTGEVKAQLGVGWYLRPPKFQKVVNDIVESCDYSNDGNYYIFVPYEDSTKLSFLYNSNMNTLYISMSYSSDGTTVTTDILLLPSPKGCISTCELSGGSLPESKVGYISTLGVDYLQEYTSNGSNSYYARNMQPYMLKCIDAALNSIGSSLNAIGVYY